MNFNQVFNLKGINFWILAAGLGMNFLWTMITFGVAFLLLQQGNELSSLLQAVIIIGSFLGPFLTGWICGSLAADGRGPTYGAISTASSLIVVFLVLLPSGLFGLLVAVVTFLGGLNGGVFSLRRARL